MMWLGDFWPCPIPAIAIRESLGRQALLHGLPRGSRCWLRAFLAEAVVAYSESVATSTSKLCGNRRLWQLAPASPARHSTAPPPTKTWRR